MLQNSQRLYTCLTECVVYFLKSIVTNQQQKFKLRIQRSLTNHEIQHDNNLEVETDADYVTRESDIRKVSGVTVVSSKVLMNILLKDGIV